ncbi:MAG: hypothetical protein GY820_18860 [Gammaproteobacteria bacterium]|nr:hypothetical protein [Gammaproteobacteria bacterium]
MPVYELIFTVAGLLTVASGFVAIGLLFYIGKTRIKELDKAVLGYEFPHDSIFALIIRVPNYAGGFLWKWSAQRTGLEGKIDHFDNHFQWPFKALMILIVIGTACLSAVIVLDMIYDIT